MEVNWREREIVTPDETGEQKGVKSTTSYFWAAAAIRLDHTPEYWSGVELLEGGVRFQLSPDIRFAYQFDTREEAQSAIDEYSHSGILSPVLRYRDTSSVLSQREREVATAVATGQTNVQIGRDLSIADRTVQSHLRSIFGKWGGEQPDGGGGVGDS